MGCGEAEPPCRDAVLWAYPKRVLEGRSEYLDGLFVRDSLDAFRAAHHAQAEAGFYSFEFQQHRRLGDMANDGRMVVGPDACEGIGRCMEVRHGVFLGSAP